MPSLVGPALPPSTLGRHDQPRIPVNADWLLRPWQAADAANVVSAFEDPDVRRWNLHAVATQAEARAWIEDWTRRWNEMTDAAWAVAPSAGGDAVGFIALRMIRFAHARAELSGWAVPAGRGRGMAVQATEALARWSFDVLGLHRVFLLHSVANVASCRLATSAGFRAEGTLRGYLLHADGWHDMHMHARIHDDA